MNRISRRRILVQSARCAVGLGAASALTRQSWTKPIGANGDVRLAIVGIRRRGLELIEGFRSIPGVRIVALCDVDRDFLDAQVKLFKGRQETVAIHTDYRRLLEEKNVDAVAIATPDHWHALMAVWACQAGKDVYLEKPVSHGIWEGRKIVEAARKYGRIVQAGTQNISDPGLEEAFSYIREGRLGKIQRIRCVMFKRRDSIGKVDGPQPIPESVNYDLYMGPASLAPLMRKNLHYDWHWVWPTGTGEVGNLGAHRLDLVRWALGRPAPPKRAIAMGGRFGYEDDGETPNTLVAFLDYDPIPVVVEVRGLPVRQGAQQMDSYHRIWEGVGIDCEQGLFVGGLGTGTIYDRSGQAVKRFPSRLANQHLANFLEAVRSRRVEDLHSDILEGHRTATLCHMMNISYRIGSRRSLAEARKAAEPFPEFLEVFERLTGHLAANEVNLNRSPLIVGPLLSWEDNEERFVGPGSESANMFLKRNYREPFVVPEKV